jgi:hypothetical protein
MPVLKVLTLDAGNADGVGEIDASIEGGRALTSATGVAAALGWELKPEGLCKGDICVPVRDDAGIGSGDRIDLGAVIAALGMSSLLDEEAAVLAVSVPSADRRAGLQGRVAPDFTLPDLDGELRSLEEFKDRKRLLIAFASW